VSAVYDIDKHSSYGIGLLTRVLEKLFIDKSFQSRLFESHCFCFFIDGLDEHEEVDHEDHVYLVRLLKSWIQSSNGNLKMCVLGRDYNVFLNGFSGHRRLRLPDLTVLDIREYVREPKPSKLLCP
jgi:hypothetical protein